MKKLSTIFLMLIAVPAFVSADSNIPETKSEPEVVLSNDVKVSNPAALKTDKKKKKKRVSKAKKVNFEDSTINDLGMSEEEEQIMQSRNKADAYRPTKRKPKERAPKSK